MLELGGSKALVYANPKPQNYVVSVQKEIDTLQLQPFMSSLVLNHFPRAHTDKSLERSYR